MSRFATLDRFEFNKKTVIVRLDLNLPIVDGKLNDDSRITRALPTLNELINKGAKVVILSHYGRPDGKMDSKYSLARIATILQGYIDCSVHFFNDCVGKDVENAINGLSTPAIIVLENLRFYPEEEANDPEFAKALAGLGDIYVNDAFSCSHRAHASIVGLPKLLPAAAGRAMERELSELEQVMTNPKHPLTAIVGGSKVSSKIELLTNLCQKVDHLIIGGGMANTFLAAQDIHIGASRIERDHFETAKAILIKAQQHNCQITLPTDAYLTTEIKANPSYRKASISTIKDNEMIVDIGNQSAIDITRIINQSATIIWNGPVGIFEIPPFDFGSNAIAQALAKAVAKGSARVTAGGGDTLAALSHAGCINALTYTSTAGGAFLEWLEGKDLPGVKALALSS